MHHRRFWRRWPKPAGVGNKATNGRRRGLEDMDRSHCCCLARCNYSHPRVSTHGSKVRSDVGSVISSSLRGAVASWSTTIQVLFVTSMQQNNFSETQSCHMKAADTYDRSLSACYWLKRRGNTSGRRVDRANFPSLSMRHGDEAWRIRGVRGKYPVLMCDWRRVLASLLELESWRWKGGACSGVRCRAFRSSVFDAAFVVYGRRGK